MASYISPSRRLTDFLSSYLQFDDATTTSGGGRSSSSGSGRSSSSGAKGGGGGGGRQLNLGLWGGDLRLRHVSLRREAIEPLLNGGGTRKERGGSGSGGGGGRGGTRGGSRKRPRGASGAGGAGPFSTGTTATFGPSSIYDNDHEKDKPQTLQEVDPPPLQFTLVRGTIGHLRLVVPWKQLVVGMAANSPVDVILEDVTIVLGLVSPLYDDDGETTTVKAMAMILMATMVTPPIEMQVGAMSPMHTTKSERRGSGTRSSAAWPRRSGCISAGCPSREEVQVRAVVGIGTSRATLCSMRRMVRQELQQVRQQVLAEATATKEAAASASSAGLFGRLLQSAASSLVWRLVSNLRAKIRNLRVVIIVDGVEVGLTVDSHDVEYWLGGEDGDGDDGGGGDDKEKEKARPREGGDAAADTSEKDTSSGLATEAGAGAGAPFSIPSVVVPRPAANLARPPSAPSLSRRSTHASSSSRSGSIAPTAPPSRRATVSGPTAPTDAQLRELRNRRSSVMAGRTNNTAAAAATATTNPGSFGKIVKIRGLGVYIRPTTASPRSLRQVSGCAASVGSGGTGGGASASGAGGGTSLPPLPQPPPPPPLPRPFPDDYIIKPSTADVTVKLLRNETSSSASSRTKATGKAQQQQQQQQQQQEEEKQDDTKVEHSRPSPSASSAGGSLGSHTTEEQSQGSEDQPPKKKIRRGKRQKKPLPSSVRSANDAETPRATNVASASASGPATFNFDDTTSSQDDAENDSAAEVSTSSRGPLNLNETTSGQLNSEDGNASVSSSRMSRAAGSVPKSGKTPLLEVSCSIGQIRSIYSTRHHALVNSFVSCAARIRNGRPEEAIKSHLGTGNDSGYPGMRELRTHVPLPPCKSSSVVRKWWRYARDNVVRDVRRKRIVQERFKPRPKPFRWASQTYLRDEYVEVYTRVRLGGRTLAAFPGEDLNSDEVTRRSVTGGPVDAVSGLGEDDLARFEDELPIEQVLLYRSIARSMKISGTSRVRIKVGTGGEGSAFGVGMPRVTSTSFVARPQPLNVSQRSRTCAPAITTPSGSASGTGKSSSPGQLSEYRVEGTPVRQQRKRHRKIHSAIDHFEGTTGNLSSEIGEQSDHSPSSRTSLSTIGSESGDAPSLPSLSRPTLHRSLSDRSSSRDSISASSSKRLSLTQHRRATTSELAAVLEDVPFEEMSDVGSDFDWLRPYPSSRIEEDVSIASWRRISDTVDASGDPFGSSLGDDKAMTLSFLLSFSLQGISLALCSPLSSGDEISSRSLVDSTWGDLIDDVSVLSGYSSGSSEDDAASSMRSDPVYFEEVEDKLISVNGKLHKVILSGKLSELRAQVQGHSGGKKTCSFMIGDLRCFAGDKELISSGRLAPDPGSSLSLTLDKLDNSQGAGGDGVLADSLGAFAGGIITLDYIVNECNDRSQYVTGCHASFATLRVFLHTTPLAAACAFFSYSPSSSESTTAFVSIPYRREYEQLVSTRANLKSSPQHIDFFLSVDGVQVMVPIVSGDSTPDDVLAVASLMGIQISHIYSPGEDVPKPGCDNAQTRKSSVASDVSASGAGAGAGAGESRSRFGGRGYSHFWRNVV